MDACKVVAEKIEEERAENEAAQAIIKKVAGSGGSQHTS